MTNPEQQIITHGQISTAKLIGIANFNSEIYLQFGA